MSVHDPKLRCAEARKQAYDDGTAFGIRRRLPFPKWRVMLAREEINRYKYGHIGSLGPRTTYRGD